MKTLAAAALLALLAAALPAHAQTGATLTVDSAGTVPYAGAGALPFSLTVGCVDLVTADGVTLDVVDPPAWLNATTFDVGLSAADCVGSQDGNAVATGTFPFTVSAAAPGVTPTAIKLKASIGDATEDDGPVTVAYKSSFTVKPDVAFPFTVTNRTTTFTAKGTQASNAPSMIMVDDFSCDSGATISGIGAQQYNNVAGKPETKTYTVTFNAPKTEWTKATCTLKVYGHYNFNGMAGDPTDRTTLAWEFDNGGVPEEKASSGGGKDSPAPVAALTALGLLALAGVVRRKA